MIAIRIVATLISLYLGAGCFIAMYSVLGYSIRHFNVDIRSGWLEREKNYILLIPTWGWVFYKRAKEIWQKGN